MATTTSIVLQPMQWAYAKDIEDIEPVSDRDADIFSELRAVLLRHNAVERFGITLLHKHFDMAPEEQLVEFTDLAQRTLTLQPMRREAVPNTIQTSWRFSSDPGATRESMAECVSRCFYDPNSTPQHANKHTIG